MALLCSAVAGAQELTGGQTVVVLPFENSSKAPGLEWIGESFPEIVGSRLAAGGTLYVVSRDVRRYAFDRLGIPSGARPSLATLIKLGESMDADYLVVGRYTYDGQTFSASAQLLDLRKLRLTPEMRAAGPLPQLLDLELALTWDLLRKMNPNQIMSRNEFVAAGPTVRLDALEKYIRGVMATDRAERLQLLKDAVRINAGYTPAILQLAKTYYAARDYAQAATWFAHVPQKEPAAREAQFYLGMSSYYTGDYSRAQAAFDFVATRLPLTEVYNNLGVVAGRRGSNAAVEYFQRAVRTDPSDPDYHFNLAVALYKAGDATGAAKQLREMLALRSDAEAKAFLEQAIAGPPPTVKGQPSVKVPLERIKPNYDESSFRQLAMEIESFNEQRLAEAEPKVHAAFHVQHGREMLAQELLVVAERDFREALVLDPANAGAHAGLARFLELTSDPKAARAEAQAALRLAPNADAFLVLAQLDLDENKPEAASANVEQALKLEPANAAAQTLKSAIAAKLAEKGQPLRNP